MRFARVSPRRRRGTTFALEVGAEVADEAAGFFGGALGIEGDEAFEDLLVGDVGGPAVGGEDGGVEIVMNLLEDADQSGVVGFLVFIVERFAGSQLF